MMRHLSHWQWPFNWFLAKGMLKHTLCFSLSLTSVFFDEVGEKEKNQISTLFLWPEYFSWSWKKERNHGSVYSLHSANSPCPVQMAATWRIQDISSKSLFHICPLSRWQKGSRDHVPYWQKRTWRQVLGDAMWIGWWKWTWTGNLWVDMHGVATGSSWYLEVVGSDWLQHSPELFLFWKTGSSGRRTYSLGCPPT